MADGKITHFGPASQVRAATSAGYTRAIDTAADTLILPGFIDCHVHYPQTQIIGAYGEQLSTGSTSTPSWPSSSLPTRSMRARWRSVFLQECLRAGTTTAAVFCTVHPQSVDAFFEEAQALDMRMIAGKVLMDRNAPAALTDTAQQGYDESKALIAKWHGRGRQLYAVTPRFAATSTPEQMEMAGALWAEHPGTYLQSHVSENRAEVAWVRELYPERSGYLDVYDHYRQLGPRVHLRTWHLADEQELHRCHDTGTAIAHCPTSNQFLGSGLFNLQVR